MRGRKNPDKPQQRTNILPPCRVCGEPGTGFHYGVTVCGACKGFFRRSIIRVWPYKCLNNASCKIGPSTSRRGSCPKCRYDKCLAVGMSKDAIKIGRYTTAKKCNDTKQAIVEHISAIQNSPDTTSSTFVSCQETGTQQQQDQQQQQQQQYQQQHQPGPCVTGPPSNDETKALSESPLTPEYFGHDLSFTDVSVVTPQNSLPFDSHDKSYNSIPSDDSFVDVLLDEINPQINGMCLGNETPNYIPDATMPYQDNEHTPTSTSNIFKPSVLSYRTAAPVMDSITFTDPMRGLKLGSSVFHANSIDTYSPDSIAEETTYNSHVQTTDKLISPLENTSAWELSSSLTLTNDNPPKKNVSKQTGLDRKEISSYTLSQSFHMEANDVQPCSSISSNTITSSGTVTVVVATEPDKNRTSLTPYDFNTKNPLYDQNYIHRHDSCLSKNKRAHDRDVEESTNKKPHVSEKVGPDSSQETKALVTASQKHDFESQPAITTLLVPSYIKLVVSMFETFPFKSFEKQYLAPLLRVCYGLGYTRSSDKPLINNKTTRKTGDNSPRHNNISTFRCPVILQPALATEQPTCAQDLTYDPQDMEALYDYLFNIHCRYYGSESDNLSAYEREMAMETYSRICQLYDSLFGAVRRVDDDKYFTILETTGIDVDRRREWFTHSFGEFDTSFTTDIKFIRSLPGFKSLSLKDRTTLAKSTFIIFMKMRQYRTMDFDRDVCIDEVAGVATRYSVLCRVVPHISKSIELLKDVVNAMKDLDISFEELLILKAIVVFVCDFCEDLEDPELVRSWQTMYLKCLLHHHRKTRTYDADDRFNKIFQLLQKANWMGPPIMTSRRLATKAFSRLTKGYDYPLFQEICINLPNSQTAT